MLVDLCPSLSWQQGVILCARGTRNGTSLTNKRVPALLLCLLTCLLVALPRLTPGPVTFSFLSSGVFTYLNC